MCMLSNNIYDYVNVSQGKITVPGMDDGEECQAMDVSHTKNVPFPPFTKSLNVHPERTLSVFFSRNPRKCLLIT